jgi:hypothetical protein
MRFARFRIDVPSNLVYPLCADLNVLKANAGSSTGLPVAASLRMTERKLELAGAVCCGIAIARHQRARWHSQTRVDVTGLSPGCQIAPSVSHFRQR